MSIWDRITSSSNDHDLLLLSWADKHPILYTMIEIMSPSLFGVIIVVAFQILIKVMGKRR
jgi:hypothetical protein